MKKVLLLFVIFSIINLSAKSQGGPYPPAAGVEGSTAIPKGSQLFRAWATGIELHRGFINIANPSFTIAGTNKVSYGSPSAGLGEPEGDSMEVVSLGDRGVATLTFDFAIINGEGYDFAVFENSFSDTFLELAFVEVSSDGKRFVRFPSVSETDPTIQVGGFGLVDPTFIHNFAGKYRQGFGTPFDLEDLKDSTGINLNNIRFIRLIDVVGTIDPKFASYDSKGNIVNDPYPTDFWSGGFDLDGIGIINIGQEYKNTNFNNLTLAADSFWIGSDNSGGFTDGNLFFSNTYNNDYQSWYGFAYSNTRDDTTAGYLNQYSSIAKGGMDATSNIGTNYAVAYLPGDINNGNAPIPAHFKTQNGKSYAFNGFYITNSTFAYFSMKDGDQYAKKFGGESGNDPDWLKVVIWGTKADGTSTDSIEFYLADYRFSSSEDDYIVNNWRWVDLSELGFINQVNFTMKSSDNGAYGINTPTYFCIDNVIYDGRESQGAEKYATAKRLNVYPNPSSDFVFVNNKIGDNILISDITGKIISQIIADSENVKIDIKSLKSGIYAISVYNNAENGFAKFVKK